MTQCEASAAKVKEIIDDIESREFRLDRFDDALVRHSIERGTIADKDTIRVKVTGVEEIEIKGTASKNN